MEAGLQKELNSLVDNAVKTKELNEKLNEKLNEVKRLLYLCKTEDRSDMSLTLELLRDVVDMKSTRSH